MRDFNFWLLKKWCILVLLQNNGNICVINTAFIGNKICQSAINSAIIHCYIRRHLYIFDYFKKFLYMHKKISLDIAYLIFYTSEIAD